MVVVVGVNFVITGTSDHGGKSERFVVDQNIPLSCLLNGYAAIWLRPIMLPAPAIHIIAFATSHINIAAPAR